MSRRYRLAPIFACRPTGVPFDVLTHLASPTVTAQARELLVAERAYREATARAVDEFPRAFTGERKTRERTWKKLTRHEALPPGVVAANGFLAAADAAGQAYRTLVAAIDAAIDAEYARSHGELVRAGARELPDFLVFESESFASEVDRLESALDDTEARRRDRRKDRTIALYLQRVCSKNDTFSRFGPSAWGTTGGGDGVVMQPADGIAQRRIEIERWVVKGLADAINRDPEARDEARPRRHAHGRIEGGTFVRVDENRTIELTPAEQALVARCDGATPAYGLGDREMLASLADRGVLRWEHELMARDIGYLSTLLADVETWRPGPTRDTWLQRLAPLAEIAHRFGSERSPDARRAITHELYARLEELGVAQRARSRALYAAKNPINENTVQDGTFTIGTSAGDKLLAQAGPWCELFQDTVALACSRVFERLRPVVDATPRREGRVEYLAFLRTAKENGLFLDEDAFLETTTAEVFTQLRREFAELLSTRADAPEWELTAEDCAFVRQRYRLPPAGSLSVPSADLQVCAASPDDAAAGRLQWVISELHHPLVLMQHGLYWSCPDKATLAEVTAEVVANEAFPAREAGATAPVHGQGEAIMYAMPRPVYVGQGRPKPDWHSVPPVDVEIVVDEQRCDLRLRDTRTGDDLGSIIHQPRLMSGMHPFFPLDLAPHCPRLRIGDVIVQRESWHIQSAELGADRPEGVSSSFIAAIERLRAERGIPRHVFARPLPSAAMGSGWTRDKDNKPMYVDLESVVFLDILERRLRKYGTVKLVEMRPTPDELIWQSSQGRFTFEIRVNLLEETHR